MKEEESLVTLREIADEIGVHYRTIIDYKNHFKDFIALKYDGQGMRYPARYTDLFRLIIAMREEGYSLAVIKMILSGQVQLAEGHHLSDWLAGWQDGETHPGMSGCIHPSEDGGIRPSVDGGIHPSQDVAELTRRHHLSNLHANIPVLTALATHTRNLQEQIGHHQQHLTALHDRLASLEQELGIAVDHEQSPSPVESIDLLDNDDLLQPLIDLRRELESEVEVEEGDVISEDSGEDNCGGSDAETAGEGGAETEGDADTSSDTAPVLPVTSDQPQPTISLSERIETAIAGLELVRNSIVDSKPDRQVLLDWVSQQQSTKPKLSYPAMVSLLDQHGIPTLSGTRNWHRGTLWRLVNS